MTDQRKGSRQKEMASYGSQEFVLGWGGWQPRRLWMPRDRDA